MTIKAIMTATQAYKDIAKATRWARYWSREGSQALAAENLCHARRINTRATVLGLDPMTGR